MDKLPAPCRCGQEPVVWMHDGIVLIQCQDPHCRNIAIIGQQTHRMAVQAWDEHQAQAAKLERSRRTIRALVVAARALRQAGWNWRGGRVTTDFMVLDVRARIAQIRLQEKLNSEQAREADNG